MKHIGKIILLLLAFTLRVPQGQAQEIAPVTNHFFGAAAMAVGQTSRANIASFSRLLRPLTDKLGERMGDSRLAPVAQRATGAELGLLLGWMSTRVLGQYDLLIVEDLQHLPARAAGALVRIVDYRLPRRLPLVVTAAAGPARLTGLPARLTSRLSAGLVVGLEPLSPASRRVVLGRLAEQRGVRVGPGVLDWLADHTPGGVRSLLGALTKRFSRSPAQKRLRALITDWKKRSKTPKAKKTPVTPASTS